MGILDKLASAFTKEKSLPPIKLEEFEGVPEYTVPMSTIRLTFNFVTKEKLLERECIQKISEELNVPQKVVRDDLKRLTNGIGRKTTVCLEYPYVDEYYRDTYYSYYSRKHTSYNRFCFRISFFDSSVNQDNFYDIEELDDKFLGYAVLRPTPNRIIGTTFLSPKAYTNSNYSLCMCQKAVSIKGSLLRVYGFPFSGQDGEMNSCSETAVSLIFDYFSYRYNRYTRLLPSQISSAISDCVIDRKQPCKGVEIDTAVGVILKNGFNTRQYRKVITDDERMFLGDGVHFEEADFYRLLHIYIESGFPLYVVTERHAFVAIGRENKLFAGNPKIVIMDDNMKPYELLGHENEVIGFIVPMAENILLEAKDIDAKAILNCINTDYPSAKVLDAEAKYYYRVFLTTSRSYKDYIIKEHTLPELRELVVCTAMPKFVWICEVIKSTDAKKAIDSIELEGVLVLDTTDNSDDYNHLLIAKSKTHILIPSDDRTHMLRKQYIVHASPDVLHPFKNNLKGKHTNWKH